MTPARPPALDRSQPQAARAPGVLGQSLRHAQGGTVGVFGQGQDLDLILMCPSSSGDCVILIPNYWAEAPGTSGEGPDQCQERRVEGHNTLPAAAVTREVSPWSLSPGALRAQHSTLDKFSWICTSQNARMVWAERDLKAQLIPTPLLFSTGNSHLLHTLLSTLIHFVSPSVIFQMNLSPTPQSAQQERPNSL